VPSSFWDRCKRLLQAEGSFHTIPMGLIRATPSQGVASTADYAVCLPKCFDLAMLIETSDDMLEVADRLTSAANATDVDGREGDHRMDLEHLAGLIGDAEKEQLRDELHRLESRYRQADSGTTLEELRTTADQRVHQLRFFVDLMQGYQLIFQLAERGLRRREQPPSVEGNEDAPS
jgi:hypothetical protein